MESTDDDRGHYRIIVNEVDPFKRVKLLFEAIDDNGRNPLDETILADDGEAFLCISGMIGAIGDKILPHHMSYICNKGAINCASALLDPDTTPLVDINEPVSEQYPLSIASLLFRYDLVDLFLRHGARTDVCDIILGQTKDIPLKRLLDMLNYHAYLIDWNPKNSIYTLVTILCLPQMKVILETVKLLVWNTKDVNEVFNYYLEKEECKLIQMAVLLMVAKELFMTPLQGKCGSFVAECLCAYQSIKQEFGFLATLEKKLLVGTTEVKDRMACLISVLALFELFDKAGDAMRSYIQSCESDLPRGIVIEDVVKILKEARFVLKDEDIDLSNIDRIKPGMTVQHLQKNGSFFQHEVLHPLEYGVRMAKWNHLPNTRSKELVKQRELNNMFNPQSPALRTKLQTNCFLRCCPTAFYKPMKVQNKGITSSTQGHLLLLKPSNLLASCALI